MSNNNNGPNQSHRGNETSTQQTQPVIPNPNERAHSVPVGSLRPEDIVSSVSKILADFNAGHISKACCVARVTSALRFDDNQRDTTKEQALQSYLDQIERIEDAQGRSSRSPSRRRSPTGRAYSRGEHRRSPSRRSSSKSCQSREHSYQSKHRYRYDYDSDSSSSDSDRPTRKRRLRESDMPWYGKEAEGTGGGGRESCQKSCQLLRTYGEDLSQVKRWITTSSVAPSGFPASEWENLLRGKPLNLDVIFSSLYHVVPVKENRGRIGDHEISLGFTEPSKKVQTHGDWTIAWNIATNAIVFLFPHRRDELAKYAEFIQREFSARRVEAHYRVLLFDRSIRNEVGGGTRILLTDFQHFDIHRTAILSNDGVFAAHENRFETGSRRFTKPAETCGRFNAPYGCSNSDASCKYRHVCRKCGKGGHGAASCNDGKK